MDLTSDETEQYFSWYLSHIDERTEYLKTIVSRKLNIEIEELDYSIKSLIPIWEWFLNNAEVEKVSNHFFEKIKKGNSEENRNISNSTIFDIDKKFSTYTEYIIKDIAMYVAKVLTKNYPQLKWTYKRKPKNYIHVNEPILTGFVDNSYGVPFLPDFEPNCQVRLVACKLIRDENNVTNKKDLYDMCNKWIELIQKNN